MKTKQEYTQIVADILRGLRTGAGISRAKMASIMNVDERTYGRYEAGKSSPSLPEFLAMLDLIDAPALPTIIRYLYPESYGDLTGKSDTSDIRDALASYILRDATDRDVRQLAYIVHGPHGSPLEAQLQMFCALDHMPMDVRLTIAKLTLNAWEIESIRGGLINPENVQPDIELLRAAIIKAQQAFKDGRNSYTTAIK